MGREITIITTTIIQNTLVINEDDIAGMTAKEIMALMDEDPEVFGIDLDPYIIPDQLTEIMDEDGNVLFTDTVEDMGGVIVPK